MKIVSTYLAGIKTQFRIYENHEEAVANNIVPKELIRAQKGDYILTDNGYYVPVTNTAFYYQNNNTKCMFKISLPRMKWVCACDLEHTQLYGKRQLIYSFEPQDKSIKKLSVHVKLFANLLVRGMDLFSAYRKVFGNKRNQDMISRISRLLEFEGFYKYLESKGYMNTAKNELKKSGIDMEYFVKKMKGLMESDTAPPPLRKWAFETVFKLLNEDELPMPGGQDEPKQLPASNTVEGMVDEAIERAIQENQRHEKADVQELTDFQVVDK